MITVIWLVGCGGGGDSSGGSGGHDNVYNVTVTATDAALNSAEQNISVTVTDVAEQTAVPVKKTGQTISYDQSGNEVTDGSVDD